MQVSKWGNSLAIRLPAALVEVLNLKAGDEVEVNVAGHKEFVIERKMTREEAIAKIRSSGMRLPADYKFNREEINARR